MRPFLLIVLLSVLLLLSVSFVVRSVDAQSAMTNNSGRSIISNPQKPDMAFKSFSLLDPSRFTMKNNYLMSFSSVSGNGSLVGMYINSMEYHFKAPIVMRMKVAYESKTGQLFGSKDAYTGNPSNQNGRVTVPSFDLVYRPSKNTTIGFYFRDMSSSYNQNYGYGNMYGNSRYDRRSRYSNW